MNTIRFKAGGIDANNRIDSYLAVKQNRFTRSGLEMLFKFGNVFVNGREISKNYRLKAGDEIELIAYDEDVEISVKPQNLPLEILYEDEYLLVVNKAKGMVVHPSSPQDENTLVNALLYHCGEKLSSLAGELRPGIVHRIDKDTSGLLVVAKTDKAHEGIKRQVEARTMSRLYNGVVHGNIKTEGGVINAPIGRHPVYRTKNCVTDNGRDAVTHYRVIRRFDCFTHAEFTLLTGRMHQIRVHMANIGHPLAGDTVYGPKNHIKSMKGQCLHATTLGFTHPETGEELKFFAELPQYFTDFLEMLERYF